MAQPKMKPSIEEIKEKLAPIFKDKELQLALVFGSTVTGGFKKQQSDIDRAFLFDKRADIFGWLCILSGTLFHTSG